jgi:hypothetical protein
MLLPLAQEHNLGGLGTETPGGGLQTQWFVKKIWSQISNYSFKAYINHAQRAAHEQHLGSMCKQRADEHSNLDQGAKINTLVLQAHEACSWSTGFLQVVNICYIICLKVIIACFTCKVF